MYFNPSSGSFVIRKENNSIIIFVVSFILPTALFVIYISIDMVTQSWVIFEGSSEAGGLNLVFILKSLIPISGVLIFLQGISELIKHIRVSRS